MPRIADDFAAIRARLAELRGETPSGGAREFNADELIIISDVSVPLSSLRIEAELDADAYKRGAEVSVLGIDCGGLDELTGPIQTNKYLGYNCFPGQREPELLEDIRRYWREAVQKAETKTAKFERGLQTLNEALARRVIAATRHSELVALMQERFGFLTIIGIPRDGGPMSAGRVALNRRGSIRWVMLTRRRAYKFPKPDSWRSFLYGLLNNMNEAEQSLKPGACPVLWRLPGGWLNVMPRCREVGEQDFALIDARAWARDRGLVVEPKRDSFGLLDGAFVAIDYGWPRELRW